MVDGTGEDARKSLTNDTQELSTALSWLSDFIAKHANPKFVQVWGNGASFDCVILRNSYALAGHQAPGSGGMTATSEPSSSLERQLGSTLNEICHSKELDTTRLMMPFTKPNTFQQSGKS